MVMTGFLPTHSIETPMDEAKAQGKAEIMRNRVIEAPHNEMVWALLQDSPAFARDIEVINALMTNPGTSGRDMLLAHPDIVRLLAQRRDDDAFTSINKDKLLQQLEARAASRQTPRMFDEAGNILRGLPAAAMVDLELFIDWLHGVIELIFDSIMSDEPSKTVRLEAVNFDVPTERDLKVLIVAETSGATYEFSIPWYGRQVIKHDPVAFIMLAMLHIAKGIEE